MPDLAYVNGCFCDPADAVISIDDRGFQYADGVYEVIVAHNGTPFKMAEHLSRLRRSLELIDLVVDDSVDFDSIIREGIKRAGHRDTMVYLQVTRGVQARSHVYRDDLTPTIVATFRPKPVVDDAVRAAGVPVVTVDDMRRKECEIKATALLPNVMALNRARRDGYHDAVFVSATGEVREATSSNVFAVRNGRLITPARSASILHGITRQYILECAARSDVTVVEAPLTVDELQTADEAFLSSTTIDILAITRVNAHQIGNGSPGPVTDRLYAAFLEGLREPA